MRLAMAWATTMRPDAESTQLLDDPAVTPANEPGRPIRCARAVSRHTAAAPPSSATSSTRSSATSSTRSITSSARAGSEGVATVPVRVGLTRAPMRVTPRAARPGPNPDPAPDLLGKLPTCSETPVKWALPRGRKVRIRKKPEWNGHFRGLWEPLGNHGTPSRRLCSNQAKSAEMPVEFYFDPQNPMKIPLIRQ